MIEAEHGAALRTRFSDATFRSHSSRKTILRALS